jgi:hypothetical protein
MKAKYLVIAIVALAACGCGITEQAETQRQMQESQTVYSQCLQQDRPDTTGCEGYKQIYESDRKAYQEASEKTSFFGLVVEGCPPLYALVKAYNSWKHQTPN